MGAPLHCNTCVRSGGELLESWDVDESKWYCGVMVEATNNFRLYPASISYEYKLFQKLNMLWMDVWVHPYTVTPVQVGVNFWEVGVWVGANGIVVSWLRLQTASDCIPHPHHMYTKCLAPWYAVDGHMGAPLHCYTSAGGGEFLESWGVGESEWYCGVMVEATNSFSRHPASIPYVYKVFSTLICCGWTYGCTLTLFYQCRCRWNFEKLGCGGEQMVLWCHGWGYKQLQKVSHIHIICIQSVLASWYAVDGYMGAPLHCYACVVGVNFWNVKVWVKANDIVVSWSRLQTASDCIPHPYNMYTKCFGTLICCGWTYGCTLTLLYWCRWGWIFGKLGCGWEQMVLWCHGWGYKQLQKVSHIHITCIKVF